VISLDWMDLDLTPNPIQPDEASTGAPGYPEIDPVTNFLFRQLVSKRGWRYHRRLTYM